MEHEIRRESENVTKNRMWPILCQIWLGVIFRSDANRTSMGNTELFIAQYACKLLNNKLIHRFYQLDIFNLALDNLWWLHIKLIWNFSKKENKKWQLFLTNQSLTFAHLRGQYFLKCNWWDLPRKFYKRTTLMRQYKSKLYLLYRRHFVHEHPVDYFPK